ncbi:MAG: saccharopine dehydrogenase NADP-binding domain-containing protein [Polyangia bacterium]
MDTLLLYGCYGYTGRLLADEARARGLRPILAGRRRDDVEAMGRVLDLPTRVFSLDSPAEVDQGLDGVHVVLHAAGPFHRTSKPMADGCLRKRVHYLDVTGEIAVFEALCARDAEAKAVGVTLMPGVGFDVVPSDCLAAYVASKVPGATDLTIALGVSGSLSHGTALTMIENIGAGGAVRRDGRITRVPSGHATREFDFGEGKRTCVTIPWGDVSTAWHSTHVPNIEVYLSAPRAARVFMRLAGPLGPLLATKLVQRFLKSRIGEGGPTPEQRARGRSRLYAEARGPGGMFAARLVGPEGYDLTAHAGIRAAEGVLGGKVPVGYQTPSSGLGIDFVLGLPGVSRTDA